MLEPRIARLELIRQVGAIGLWNVEFRVQEHVRKVAIIDQKEQTRGVFVEATDRKYPCWKFFEILGQAGPAVGIAGCGQDPGRFVENVIRSGGSANHLRTIDPNDVLGKDQSRRPMPGPCFIDRHPIGLDCIFDPASRKICALANILVQTGR